MRKVSWKELRLKGIALLVLSCNAIVCGKKLDRVCLEEETTIVIISLIADY